MKKIFITFSTAATFIAAVVLTSCNNAEEVKKQTEAQAASIQTAVDEKLNGLQAEVDAECAALVDSLANVQYQAFLEESKKTGKKVAAKPKTGTKKTEDRKLDVGQNETENKKKLDVGQKTDAPVNKRKLDVGQKP